MLGMAWQIIDYGELQTHTSTLSTTFYYMYSDMISDSLLHPPSLKQKKTISAFL